jgi:DNA-binding NarL/FixJ family response regulator
MSLATTEINEAATHVLAVDDSAADRNLLRLSLLGSSHCYKLACAERLSEGLSMLEKQRADVVLLDLNLPDSQGKQTIEKIMRYASHVPVLVLTGSDDDRLAQDAMRSGVQDYILKGQMDSVALSRAMRHAIERHNLLMASRLAWNKRPGPEDDATEGSSALSSALACISEYGDSTLMGVAGSLVSRERWPGTGACVMKSREGYEGFVIESRVHELTEGSFSVEFSIEDHDSCGVTERQFYIPSIFEEPTVAMETALQAGRQRIAESLWARHRVC